MIFNDFRVPAENLLEAARGDGLTIAYHGLNLGRVALCANAAGTMRLMLANMLPWAKFRKTYGAADRHARAGARRIGRLAGLIVGCDASSPGARGCSIKATAARWNASSPRSSAAKSQKEAAIELFMKTHGGRSFLHGHIFGDNVHEFLAPCIYEGEGEMLGMAFFKSLVKAPRHAVLRADRQGAGAQRGIKQPNWPTRRTSGSSKARCGLQQVDDGPEARRRDADGRALPDCPPPRGPRRSSLSMAATESAMEISGDDAQASTDAGRSPMPHGGTLAAGAGCRSRFFAPASTAAARQNRSCKTRPTSLCQNLRQEAYRRAADDRYFRRRQSWGGDRRRAISFARRRGSG